MPIYNVISTDTLGYFSVRSVNQVTIWWL